MIELYFPFKNLQDVSHALTIDQMEAYDKTIQRFQQIQEQIIKPL